MYRQTFILFLFCSMFDSISAQLPKASEYFPLQVGNVWQYKPNPDFFPDREITIIDELFIQDTIRVYRAQIRFTDEPNAEVGFNYYHYNLDSTVVYKDENVPEVAFAGLPILDTSQGLEGRWQYIAGDCVCTFAVTDTGSSVFFGENRRWADVNTISERKDTTIIDPTFHWRFVIGLGQVEEGIDTLLYAKVNSKEFGTPVTVRENRDSYAPSPQDFILSVFPNPIRGSATIHIEGINNAIEIMIANILGETVRSYRFVASIESPIRVSWDGRDARGQLLPSGTYFIRVRAEASVKTLKIILLH